MAIALLAGKYGPEHAISAFDCRRPGTVGPRRVVADMLIVTACEFSDPMPLDILKEAYDSLVHEALSPKFAEAQTPDERKARLGPSARSKSIGFRYWSIDSSSGYA